MKLQGKVAIVTGGARGIGAAIVRAYVAQGAKVVIADIEAELACDLASELGDAAMSTPLDVRDINSIQSVLATTATHFGGVDILVDKQTGKPYVLEVNHTPAIFSGLFQREKIAKYAAFVQAKIKDVS